MWRRDDHRVDLAGTDELLGALEMPKLLVTLAAGSGRLTEAGQFAAWDFIGQQIVGMEFTHVPHADQANTDFVHCVQLISENESLRRQSLGSKVKSGRKQSFSQ